MITSICLPTLLTLPLSFLPVFSPGVHTPDGKGPPVGSVAPEPGLRGWLRKEGAPGVKLADLKGRVVVFHTFAWNCGSCIKVGIPLAVELLEVNRERGLTVFSTTTAAYRTETLEVVERFNFQHPVTTENPLGGPNPYVDASVNPITYYFVIGRNGDVVWRGDPSTKEEECLEAIARALDQPSGRELERPLHAELAEAVAFYFGGDWSKSRKSAAKQEKRHGGKDRGDSPTISEDARYLMGRIDGLSVGILAELGRALEAGDAAAIVRAREDATTLLAKTDAGKQAQEILERLEESEELTDAVEDAQSWRELEIARPPLFPSRNEKPEIRFMKDLKRFASKHSESAFLGTAEAWLASWNEQRAKD